MRASLVSCIDSTPQEMPEEYEKRSALLWHEDIKIPVIIIHSKDDSKSNYKAQAEEIYEKLKDTTNCTFISHDDDYHGIQFDDVPKIIEWLGNA